MYFLSITASGCNPSGSSEVSETGVCTPCKEGYEGSKCNLCKNGYYKQVLDGGQSTCTGKNQLFICIGKYSFWKKLVLIFLGSCSNNSNFLVWTADFV